MCTTVAIELSRNAVLGVDIVLQRGYDSSRCGNNSVVECNLAKVEVAGSNPVSRSKDNQRRQWIPPKEAERATSGFFVLRHKCGWRERAY